MSDYSGLATTAAALERARREALIGGCVIAVTIAVFSMLTTVLLALFGSLAILLGIAFCLTVIGAIIGIPLIFLGVIALIGAAAGGAGGILFALLLGGGSGFLYYRFRLRRLRRA